MDNNSQDLTRFVEAYRSTHTMSEQAAWDALDRGDARRREGASTTLDDVRRRWITIVVGLAIVASVAGALLTGDGEPGADSVRGGTTSAASTAVGDLTGAPLPRTVNGTAAVDSDTATTASNAPASADALADPLEAPVGDHRGDAASATDEGVTTDTVVRQVAKRAPNGPRRETPEGWGQSEVRAISVVELSRDEMIRFGLVPVEDGAEMFVRSRERSTSYYRIGSRHSRFKRDSAMPRSWPAEAIRHQPTIVTRWSGEWRMLMVESDRLWPDLEERMRTNAGDSAEHARLFQEYQDSVRAFIERVSPTLIPIRLRSAAASDDGSNPDLILWYLPTREVIERLPGSIREQIERELRLAESIREGTATEEEIARTGEKPIIGALRSIAGAITRSLVTASSNGSTLELTLSKPRAVRVELFDLRGASLGEIAPRAALDAGTHRVSLATGTQAPGLYLVVATTDAGERVIQRLVLASR